MRFPNVYGIDMPTRGELIAYGRSDEEIRQAIGADALLYQSVEAMEQSVTDVAPHLVEFEASCFDGHYVTGDITPEYLDRIERERLAGAGPIDDDLPRNQMSLHFQATE